MQYMVQGIRLSAMGIRAERALCYKAELCGRMG